MYGPSRPSAVVIRLLITALALMALAAPASGARLKDIATFSGVRTNDLVGYGLVVGLPGTGDKSSSTFTMQSMANMLESMGVKVDRDALKPKNVAAVMVTVKMPASARPGSRVDATVSSVGDASSLLGGVLLLTPPQGRGRQRLCPVPGPPGRWRLFGGRRCGFGLQEHLDRGPHPRRSGHRAQRAFRLQ